MPLYEYYCAACSKHFDVQISMVDYGHGAKPKCPACGSDDTGRVFAPPNIVSVSSRRGGQSGGCCPGGRCG